MELGLGLQITLIGMGIVFATLYVLAEIVRIPRAFVGAAAPRKKNPFPQPISLPQESEIPPQHIAVIAAAVAALDQPYRIKVIEVMGSENWERSRYTEISSLN